ncbi:hypothetical protein Emag_004490 [Eimeria magna]
MEEEGSVSRLREAYEAAGQGHVFQFYERLSGDQRRTLVEEARRYDPLQLNQMIEAALKARQEVDSRGELKIRPPHQVNLASLDATLAIQQQQHEYEGEQQQQQQQKQQHQHQQQLEDAFRAALPASSACAVVSLKEAPHALRQLWRATGLRLIEGPPVAHHKGIEGAPCCTLESVVAAQSLRALCVQQPFGDDDEISLCAAVAAEGKVGVVLLAGGDGSRLGFSGVKGCFPVGPLSQCSLFSLFARRITRVLALATAVSKTSSSRSSSDSSSRNSGKARLPLYVMTSEANRSATEEAFAASGFFGLEKADVFFFSQGATPTFDLQGRLMLRSPCELRRAPDGNGGLFSALLSEGALADMRDRGLLGIQVVAVDNALAKLADPTFFGFAATSEAPVANKVIRRRSPQESVGLMCEVLTTASCLQSSPYNQQQQQQPEQQQQEGGGRWAGAVVEYSELPQELSEEAPEGDPSGGNYAYGNVCMHYFSLSFIEAVAGHADLLRSRYHLAKKKIPELRLLQGGPQGGHQKGLQKGFSSDDGDPARWGVVQPETPNGWKLELFIFDVFPLVDRVLCLEVDRDEEFAPIKCSNPRQEGKVSSQAVGELDLSCVAPDTPEDAQYRMSSLHAKWVEAATGKQLPFRSSVSKKHIFCEVSPLRSYEGEGLDANCLDGKDLSKPLLID